MTEQQRRKLYLVMDCLATAESAYAALVRKTYYFDENFGAYRRVERLPLWLALVWDRVKYVYRSL